MVDETMILRKLSDIDEYHEQVREYSNVTVAKYTTDWRVQRIIERTLQMMIESCVDIAGHIISDKSWRAPKSYADAFKILHENSVISSPLYQALEKMAKFRNIVVHHYDKVDAEIVVSILKRNLDDFMGYKEAIIEMLKTNNI